MENKMSENKELMGYPSIDKPWLKYYNEDDLSKIQVDVDSKAIDFIIELNKNHLNDIALTYFGYKISYKELFYKIERCAISLRSLGINKGDIITLVLPNIPEIVILFYAINKIGAISNLIDPRTNAQAILERTNNTNSKLLFVISDILNNKIYNFADQYEVKRIITITPANSLSKSFPKSLEAIGVNIIYKVRKYKQHVKYLSYRKFEGEYLNTSEDSIKDYEKDSAAFIVYTSGTTGGRAKGVMLSDYALNCMHRQMMCGKKGHSRQNTFLGCIPFFSAYGAMNGMHNSLCNGWIIQLIPKFNPNKFDYLIKKYKPNNSLAVPRFWETLVSNGNLNKMDFSFLIIPTVGGDKISPASTKRINDFLQSHGSSVKLVIGYGATEFGGAVSATISDYNIYKSGSVGIFFPDCKAKIIDPSTGNEVVGGDRTGELYLNTPTMMIGYYKNEEETEIITYYDESGTKYYKTGDMVHIDNDGINWIIDRYKRVMMRPDGHTVGASPIENVIMSHDLVNSCAVVGIPLDDKGGVIPTAFIRVNDGINVKYGEIIQSVDELCSDELPEREKALAYVIVDKLPYTLMGKIDYRELEKYRFDSHTYLVQDQLFNN